MATEQLFVNIIIILVAARILGEIFQRIGQPPLVGELLAGLTIGPSIFGLVLPSTDLHVLSNLAVFFLMFLAGLEIDPREIRRSGTSAIVISIIAFFIPLLYGTCASLLFGLTTVQSLFMGLLLSITAVPVSAIVLMDLSRVCNKFQLSFVYLVRYIERCSYRLSSSSPYLNPCTCTMTTRVVIKLRTV